MTTYGLRRRLVLVLLFAFFLGLGGASIFYWIELQELRDELLSNALRHQADIAAQLLQNDTTSVADLPPEWDAAYARPDSQIFFSLYRSDGRILDHSTNLVAPLPPPFGLPLGQIQRGRLGEKDVGFLTVEVEGGRLLQVARTDLTSPGLLEALSEEAVEFILYTMIPFALLSVVAIWLVVGWSLRPIVRASDVASRISPDAPAARIPVHGLPSEVRPLVDATNGALARLASAYDTVRRLTADAAHELRTPLAALTIRLQRSRLGEPMDWASIDRDLGHLRRLVQQMLVLARRDSPDAIRNGNPPAMVNLSRLARQVASQLLPLAEARSRAIEVEAPEPVTVLGHEDELHDMVRNLVENALDHGQGKVVLEAHADEHTAVLAVTDEGQGIPPELGEGAFERFRKADPSSPGAGLGLAIVKRVAERHGGRIAFTSKLGSRIEVRLPIRSG
ncbi:MAG TPA: HAMP domain-containing sensor histidine kinase [Geminicoccus sp.]|jgi:two-component system sensor histidine kinase QseC|uniref:sensor histidine kinase n=1 Tax=Geminicoccus sp. TaxID=2024832 RepID=UPI002E355A1D|nr:HAMP domain-containing sensor histidine kinase [Geminicoccus sp.]HEX2527109.1 HAMP domain-containing sensor histidine kinase [Geminicoccus sp.]